MNRGGARNAGGYSDFRGRGRSPYRGGPSAHHRHSPVGADRAFANDTFGRGDGMPRGRGNYSKLMSQGSGSRHSNHNPTSGYVYQVKKPVPGGEDGFSHTGKFWQVRDPPEAVDSGPKQSECFEASDIVHETDLQSLSSQSDSKKIHMDVRTVQDGQIRRTQIEHKEDSTTLHVDFSLSATLHVDFSRKVGPDRPFANDTFGRGDGMPRGRRNYSKLMSQGSGSRHSNHNPTSGYVYQAKKPVPSGEDGFSHTGKFWQVQDPPEAGDSGPKQSECFEVSDIVHETDLQSLSSQSDSKKIHMDARTVQIGQIRRTQIEHKEDSATLHVDFSQKVNISSLINEYELPSESGTKDQSSRENGPEKIEGIKDSGPSEHVEPFDICLPKTGTMVELKPSLLVRNREKRNENKRSMEEQNGSILRPGMILLKNYLSMGDQVKIVKACQDLGLGPGGFYQPGYRDGAKLHLKMMCLGKNWDPETSEYGDLRPIDDAKPPIIPREFYQLVEKAIKDSHTLIERDSKRNKVEEILPWMSPSICIVNFYSASGRLGLHQDKDESRRSLDKGLPVVSFSLGDSAEFLYGDQRDVDKAQKVELKSGDVLIFGGKSRHIFHGVTAIVPNTAPKPLREETNLRPGRLNLTFREY